MINGMIFAAGLGTRLYPYTKNKPKALVILNGLTLLERAIVKLKSAGVNRIIINVHHFSSQIKEFLENAEYFNIDICVSDETDMLLDTGGGLLKAKDLFVKNSPVLMYNVDVLSGACLVDFVAAHNKSNALVSMLMRECNDDRLLYFDRNNSLAGWKNTKTGETKPVVSESEMISAKGFTGIHIVDYGIFDLIAETKSFSIIDLYLRLASEHKILSVDDKSEIWVDLGKPESLTLAEKILTNNKIK